MAALDTCTHINEGDFDVIDLQGVPTGTTLTLQQHGCTVIASSSTNPLVWQGLLREEELTYEQDGVTYEGKLGTLFDGDTIKFDQFFLYPSEKSDEPAHSNLLFWLEKAFVQIEDMIEDEKVTRTEVTNFIVTQNANLKLGFDDAFMLTKANAVFDVFEADTDSDDVISEHDLKELETTLFNSTTTARYEFIDELLNAIRLTDSEIEHVYNVWDKNGNNALSISDITHWMRTHFPSTLDEETLDEIESTVNEVIEKYILGRSSFSLDEFKSLTNAAFDCAHTSLRSLVDTLAEEEELEIDVLILFGTCVQTETGFYPKHLAGMLGRAMYIVKDMLDDAQLGRDELLDFLVIENEALQLGFDESFIRRKANAIFDVLERESDADDSIGEHDLLEIQDIALSTTTARDQLIDELINAIRLSDEDMEHVWTVWDKNANGVLSVADVFHWITTHFPLTASEEELAETEETINEFVEYNLFGQSSFTLEEFKSLLNAAFDCAHSRAQFILDMIAEEEEDSESDFGDELGKFLECVQDATGFTPKPSLKPSAAPSTTTSTPTMFPTFSVPTMLPTNPPSFSTPTNLPSSTPTTAPVSSEPTFSPTTDSPTFAPSQAPTSAVPTNLPTQSPITTEPTSFPSQVPSTAPSASNPTGNPTSAPVSSRPTDVPTAAPSTEEPTSIPTGAPTTENPTAMPTTAPVTSEPTSRPSSTPTTDEPTSVPSSAPTTEEPTSLPSGAPTTEEPTFRPSMTPTSVPSSAPTTEEPTSLPSGAPTASDPSTAPTETPVTSIPTFGPTVSPSTETPTSGPSKAPVTSIPTEVPTFAPVTSVPTFNPTTDQPTAGPTPKDCTVKDGRCNGHWSISNCGHTYVNSACPNLCAPECQTPEPTAAPIFSQPTVAPTMSSPTARPSVSSPTFAPSVSSPTFAPSVSSPTFAPTNAPVTSIPSFAPSSAPTSSIPTVTPTFAPSEAPTSSIPTRMPTTTTTTPTFNPITSEPTPSPTEATGPLLTFELRGRSGSERVIIRLGGQQVQDTVLTQNWQQFSFPMPSSKRWSVDFTNDSGSRDVYYRSEHLTTMEFRAFAGWNCGKRNENSRCRTARDLGTLAWRGEYTWTLQEFGGCDGTDVLASECAKLTQPAVVEGNTNTVKIPNGNGNNGAGRIQFSLMCENGAAPLELAVEGLYPSGADDSYYVRLDNEGRLTWHTGKKQNFMFTYPPTLSTPSKGIHTVTFEHREDGVSMRRVRVFSRGCRFTGLTSEIDDYHVNVDGANSCASGSRITTEAECQQAADLMGVPYGGAYPLDYCAKGCILYDGDARDYNAMYLNTHSTGGQMADHHLVCLHSAETSAPNAEYQKGDRKSNACPSGTIAITSEATCRTAAAALGMNFDMSGNWGTSPKGCLTSEWDNRGVFYNEHSTGDMHNDQAPICKSSNNGRRALASNIESGSTNRLLLIEQSVPF